jgi:HAD superfamily hydrolase (TIGR01459 family)
MKTEIHNFSNISKGFKGVLLDAYGVFWGGNAVGLLPGAQKVMESLVANGKIVGILSNTTQLASKERSKLTANGLIEGVHYHFLITSGEAAKSIFNKKNLPFDCPKGTYWLLGTIHPKFGSHHPLFEESPFVETQDIQEADFIYISIPHINGEDQTNSDVFREKIKAISRYGLPLVCANPDLFAQEGNPPQLVVRQGSIAAIYEELGGTVFYIGKPSCLIYTMAMDLFSKHTISKTTDVIMVGDTPETDIRGANAFGMPSALVTQTGIMLDRITRRGLENTVSSFPPSDFPNYFIGKLAS